MDIRNVIIQKVDLPEFIKEYANVDLVRKGNGWRCKCPIHDNSENPESMFIDDNGGYYCFVCNSGGSVINFVADYEHISYNSAIEILARKLNINLMDDEEYKSMKNVEQKMSSLKDKGVRNVDRVMEYLTEKRGFTEETVSDFELGSDDGKLTIPLIDQNGTTVGMAYRRFDGKPKYLNCHNNAVYDKSAFLYNLDKARRSLKNKIYVVEGYMDAISGTQMGLPTVAYCSNELHRDQISTLSKFLRKDTEVVVCPDNDEAGKRRIPRVRMYFKKIDPQRQVRVVLVPDGCKDMNDMLLAGIDPSTLPTEHIDKFTMGLLLGDCDTVEKEYQCAEEYLHTVSSEMIKLDIIKMLAVRWGKDEEDLKKYFHTVGQDSDDILGEAADVTSCLNDLKKIYETGGYKTHFQQIDNCIRKVEKRQVVVIGAYSGVGKALTVDSLIMTPTGTVKMGDIKVGDIVLDETGNSTKVLHVFPQGKKEVFKVTFKDRTSVECCEDHLWKFKTKDDFSRGCDWKVKPLKEIISDYKLRRGSQEQQGLNLYIPVSAPAQFKEQRHLVSPYVMGLLLGDGGFSTKQLTFTSTEDDIINRLKSETSCFGTWKQRTGNKIHYAFKGGNNNQFIGYLRDTFNRCLGGDKFIPSEYLFDSVSNRLSLLQGLIDTDGYIDERGITQFSTKSKPLSDSVAFLIRSLGQRCFVRSYSREGHDGLEYIITIPTKSSSWFTSKKHKQQWNSRRNNKRKVSRDRLGIVSIERTGEFKEMQCITVDSPYHTYLCNDFIVTHNTDFAIEYMLRAICQDKMRVVFFSLEMPKGKLIERAVAKLIGCPIPEVEGYMQSNDTTIQTVVSKLQERLVVFDRNDLSMPEIEKRIDLVNSKNLLGGPIDMVFVDYFGYISGTEDFDGASYAAKRMKAIAKNNNLIFVMLSQLNRGGSQCEEPTMQLLKLTGDLEASGDIIFLLWRPGLDRNLTLEEKQELEYVTRLKVAKSRDGLYGPPIIEFTYNAENSRLEENYM